MSELRPMVEAKARSNPGATDVQDELARLNIALGDLLIQAGGFPRGTSCLRQEAGGPTEGG